MATIALKKLTYTYPAAQTPIFDQATLTFPAHQFTLLTGPSGAGKSTLLKLMAGLLPATAATDAIYYDQTRLTDLPLTKRASQVALMFQNPNQQFAMDTVENELIFALENRQVDPAAMPAKITRALDLVGIGPLRQRLLDQLSGGEKQKVALAVIVAMDSAVILLDEPFASVDPAARASLLQCLVQLRDQAGKTIILADHVFTGYAPLIDNLVQITAGQGLATLPPSQWASLLTAFETPTKTWPVPAPTATPLFKLANVQLMAGTRLLLAPTDLLLYQHHNTLITGPNGSGKSTFFEALVRLAPYLGTISYTGHDIKKIKRRPYARQVALLFQEAETQFLTITMAEELALSQQHAYGDYFTPARIQAALQQLNLADHTDQVIYTLSEGQKKKLQILTMLIMQTPVLLMDEPLKGLDLASVQALVTLLQTTQAATQQTLIIISHQLTGLTSLIDYHLRFNQQHLRYPEVRS
ncbi:ABC transporter ATP-binding protein [Lactobacillus sp. CBA3606]|uniref:ABC transporter ATP-binding protein n=1 Tax=Lactobacillus sp. CBA3606 TaxID=2099789 RepID=UPI000CFBD29A|nr:ABC transporter ATP-binding protein [Lactobacillus sp. CBA3606]AVK64234.1 ABC transporter ATP-binding protein [Lactobacillus sp. CBA3606]